MRPVYEGTKQAPCNCVFRAAFRACYVRFRECVVAGELPGSVSWEIIGGPSGRRTYSRRHEEYIADFTIVARRNLDDELYRVFRIYHLLGADCNVASDFLKMDRGGFWHAVYRIEQRLGRAFCELEPYPLFPLDEYFGWTVREQPVLALHPKMQRPNKLKVPLRLTA